MIQLTILAATLIIGTLIFMSILSGNMAPSKKKMKMEVERMKDDMKKWVSPLIPLDRKELELFSLGQDKQVSRSGISKSAKGIFTTIYHEPVVAYSYREYISRGGKTNALLYAQTADHEYTYWIQKGEASLFIDGQEVGVINEGGNLMGKRTNKEIASLDRSSTKYLPVSVGGREIGSLTGKKATGSEGLRARAFEFLKEDISDKEEQLFMGLALRELVTRAIPSK